MLTRYLTQSVERLFTARGGMGITAPSALQLALCRIIDGTALGGLAEREDVRAAFGGARLERRPDELCVYSGIRAGKTSIVAAAAIVLSQHVDTSIMMRGEAFRIPIVSLSKDLAAQAFAHLSNALTLSPQLRPLLLEEPDAESVWLQTPSGHPCEIRVTAGARAGASVSARWLGGAIFDEFPKMVGAEEGVVNWDHMRGECTGRILPGGMMFHIGSPWAPFGPGYDVFTEYFGRPNDGMFVVKAPGPVMNHAWWTPQRVADYRAKHPDLAVTNVDAEFADQEGALLDQHALAACTRSEPLELPPVPGATYSAAMDPGTRRNAWTLVIATRLGEVRRIAVAREWVPRPGAPLSPRATWAEALPLLRRYRITSLRTDQHLSAAMLDYAREAGIALICEDLTDDERTRLYLGLRDIIHEGTFEGPPVAHYRADMVRLRRRVTQRGVSVHLPETSDGRHCDFAPATILACRPWIPDVVAPRPDVDTAEWYRREHERMVEETRRELRRRAG